MATVAFAGIAAVASRQRNRGRCGVVNEKPSRNARGSLLTLSQLLFSSENRQAQRRQQHPSQAIPFRTPFRLQTPFPAAELYFITNPPSQTSHYPQHPPSTFSIHFQLTPFRVFARTFPSGRGRKGRKGQQRRPRKRMEGRSSKGGKRKGRRGKGVGIPHC